MVALIITTLIIVLVVVVLCIVFMYNRLITLKNRIENAWAQIDVQLKRRYDLIPNLVNTVKGYAKHEKQVLTEITNARAALSKADTMQKKAQASNMITDSLKSLFAVVENYPKLKADKNFLMLQEELAGTESKIAYSRQFYNDNVLRFNTAIQTFPTKLIASIFNFKEKEYFEAEAIERKAVEVNF